MSPSWNSPRAAASGAARLAGWLRPAPALGLALGREALAAAQLEPARHGWYPRRTLRVPVRAALFEGAAGSAAQAALTAALREVWAAFGRAARTVQVSLPDPAVSLRVLELERLPGSRRLQSELVRWRFAQELARDAAGLHCAHQVYGERAGRVLLLGLAADAAWVRLVLEACRAAGLLVTTLDMDACHRHNRLAGALCAPDRPGVLVALQPESWSLAAWDDAGRLRHVRSRWRGLPAAAESVDGADELERLAEEAKRTVRAHAQTSSAQQPLTVAVFGPPEEAAPLAARLDERLRETCLRLPVETGLADGAPPSGSGHCDLTSAAVSAAMPR